MLTFVDLIVTVSFLLIPAILGCMYCISSRSYEELALGGRNLGIVPVAFSSVIGFLAFSQNIMNVSTGPSYYANSAQMFTTAAAVILAITMSMAVFVPTLHKMKLTSVFEYLELRFDSAVLRCTLSLIFVAVTVTASAFMLRVTAEMIASIFRVPFFVNIVTIGLSSTLYAFLGGLPLAILYHAFITLALLSAMTIITVKGTEGGGGFGGVLKSRISSNPDFKFDFSLDPFSRSNDLNILLGYGFSLTCLYGIHQSQFQRYCAVANSHKKTQIALGVAIFLAAILLTLITTMALSITASFCEAADPLEAGTSEGDSNMGQFIVLFTFIIDQVKNHYGVNGLFIAATGSFALGMLSAMVNSLGVITTEDFVRRILGQHSHTTWTRILRGLTVFYGILITGLAFIPVYPDALYSMVYEILLIMISVIGSAFMAGMFLPFANKYGVGVGVLVGLTFAVAYNVETHWEISKKFGWSHFSKVNVSGNDRFPICGSHTNHTIRARSHLHHVLDSDGWSTTLLSISGHLHPSLGAIVTIFVSILASSLTGGCCQFKRLNRDHFHPLLHACIAKRKDSISSDEHSGKPLLRNPVANSHRNVDRVSGFPLAKGTSNFSLFHQRYETLTLDEVPQ